LRVAVHRLRQRYRAALRATVGSTVGSPADIDDEIRYLLAVLAG
jgi:RNA polymerase sigma-70 factor (ECF subfamily)